MRRLLLLLLVLLPVPGAGQEQGGTLSVPAPGYRIVVDTLPPLLTPVDALPVRAGRVPFALFPGSAGAWSVPLLAETLTVTPGAHLVRDPGVLAIRRISSAPFGASVYAGDSLLGTTPLLLPSWRRGVMLRFVRAGYADALAPLGDGDLDVVLERAPGLAGPAMGETGRSMTPVYLSAGAGIVAGATAAYLKIKADSRYADYRRSGDVRDLDDVHRLDRLSGIALAAGELALLTLTYELFSR